MTDTPNNTLVLRETRLDDLARLGTWLALSESGSDSEKAKGAAAALRLYYASELGLPPLAAAELSVIHGRLFVSAQLLRALAERHGYRIQRVDDSDTAATAVLSKGDVELGRSTFTIEDAKRAGLVRPRSPWETHPARMCWARASKNVIQDYAPGVALGLSLDDEAAEYRSSKTSRGDDGPVVVETTYYDPDEKPEPVEEHSRYVAPASVREQQVEQELLEFADPVEPDD